MGAAVLLLTLIPTFVLGIVAALFISPPCALGNALICEPDTARGVAFGVAAGLVFVGGLWWAVRVARPPARRSALGPNWRVAEPGVAATWYRRGGPRAVHLAAGVSVVEVERAGSRVRVNTPDGLSGWVDAYRLEPPDDGGREGGG